MEKEILERFEISLHNLPETGGEKDKFNAFRQLLIQRIDELIHHDFEKLKWILYRIDVSEKKLNEALQCADKEAATVMADLIIERQIEKAQSRKKFGSGESDWSFDV